MSKDNIVQIYANEDPDLVLEKANGDFKDLLIIGYDHDGKLDVRCSDGVRHPHTLHYLAAFFQKKLLNGDYDGDL